MLFRNQIYFESEKLFIFKDLNQSGNLKNQFVLKNMQNIEEIFLVRAERILSFGISLALSQNKSKIFLREKQKRKKKREIIPVNEI